MENLAQSTNFRNQENIYVSSVETTSGDKASDILLRANILSLTISALFVVVIIYSLSRMAMIDQKERKHRDDKIYEYEEKQKQIQKNPRWQIIEDLLQSTKDSDWRVAIIEADVFLEETLMSFGYEGKGIGEMLTGMDPNTFATYKYAWEAHKVRNDIAHEGVDYKLTKEDVVKTISMYRSVFEEFGIL